MSSIAELLATARQLGVDRLDAQLLLCHHLGRPRSWLLAHDQDALPTALAATCTAQLRRRAAGEPLAYVIGQWEFRGLVLQVSQAVLVPRPETELLVDWALQSLAAGPSSSLLDLGTGSGAIALAVAAERPAVAVAATDASPEALAVARANAIRLGLHVQFHQGDWWSAVPQEARWGCVVANPPYVAAGDAHLAALRHEPRQALTPGADGLSALRQIVHGAPAHLLPGAWLLLEHGHDQGAAVRDLLRACGFEQAQTRQDLASLDRCTGAYWPGQSA